MNAFKFLIIIAIFVLFLCTSIMGQDVMLVKCL